MKQFKLRLVLMYALLSLFVCKTFAANELITEQVTVTITNGEYLSELIKAEDAPLITNLKIVGNIDGTDIAYLRELLGVGKYYGMDKEKVKSNLHILDLSMANICEGGDYYCNFSYRGKTYQAYTANNAITAYMFASCHSLTKLTLPYNITIISSYAFYDCSELEEIAHADKITAIKDHAFMNCSKLKEFKLPELEKLEEFTFSKCSSLTSLEIPEGITYLPQSFASYCSSLKNLKLPSTLNKIMLYALSGCSSLERIDLPETLESIMDNAFAGCTSLKYFRLPEGIKDVGGYIISGCKQIEELHLPKLPLIMSHSVFSDCQVKHLYAYQERPHKINEYTFKNINYDTCTLHVPKGKREAYAEAFYWRNFATIVEMDDPTGVSATETVEPLETTRYAIDGTIVKGKKKGVNIIKYNDGTTKKVIVR
jgi:hypothetical protein